MFFDNYALYLHNARNRNALYGNLMTRLQILHLDQLSLTVDLTHSKGHRRTNQLNFPTLIIVWIYAQSRNFRLQRRLESTVCHHTHGIKIAEEELVTVLGTKAICAAAIAAVGKKPSPAIKIELSPIVAAGITGLDCHTALPTRRNA